MRKKILYAITKSRWGGAQEYVYDLATNLPKDQFEVAIAAGSEGLLLEKLSDAGIRTIIVQSLRRDIGFLSELAAFWRLLKLFRTERPDIIHLNSSKAAALGAIAAKVASLVIGHWSLVIFTVHGWSFNEDRPFIARALIFVASWLTCLFCNRIILICRADYAAAKRFIPKKRLVLIPHGLAPSALLPRAEARAFFAQKIGRSIDSDTLLIGTIAELTKNKGLPHLISTFSNILKSDFKNYRSRTSIIFVIIGEGREREVLLTGIKSLGIEDNVFMPSFIPDAARYLNGFDIFVLSSVKEGLPYALMQAMAAGLPAIATAVGGIPDLIEDGADGLLVRPKDPLALAAALRTLISSPETRARLASRARQKIETKFPFRAMITATISVYENIHTSADN